MQPSEDEIQREVEALRDIKRRSTAQGGPGALILDPDLPAHPSPPSPQSAYWSTSSTAVDDSSSSSHESGSGRNSPAEDPFHLFWVPASLHPEIAPDQFRAFLKEHARAPPDGSVSLSRSNSASSQGLGRKHSMLSRQYKPRPNDGVEEEEVVPLRRDRSSYYANSGPQLTINDLQKLEELAEEASKSDDPSKLRSVLRRSLSLNIAPSVIDQMDDMPSMGDEADAPIIVPPPGQILRRTARTKIRKPGQSNEGSHRFQTTRSRRKSGPGRSGTAPPSDGRTSSDLSSNDHGDGELQRPRRMTNEIIDKSLRPESYSEEASIFDAYVTEEPEEVPSAVVTSPPVPLVSESIVVVEPKAPEPEPAPPEGPTPVLYHPQPKRLLVPPASPEVPATSRTPSPEPASPSLEPNQQEQPPYIPAAPTRTPSPSQRKDKDDKGLFKWGGDKGSKKTAKEKEREIREQKEKEKKGFFGSLFGSKKKQEEQPQSNLGHQSGRETAVALLGASKSSKSPAPSPSPQPGGPYARYPIHVERAIYRLSHIKLANPRRPLYEQVLISNLMFWYLGVINKTQSPTTPTQPQPGANGQPAQGPSPAEKEKMEQEQREREEHEMAERERAEREKEMEAKTQPRRGSLTKPSSPGTPGRRAEMPVRGPQYELQHRAMEQEYGGSQPGFGPGSMPMGRAASAPPMNGYPGGYQARNHAPAQGMSPYSQSQSGSPQQVPDNFYYDASANGEQRARTVSPQLPPGAMPPVSSVNVDQSWLPSASGSSSPPRRPSSPSSPRANSPPSSQSAAAATQPYPNARQSRSPPPHNRYTPVQDVDGAGGMKPTRSMSATAAASPPPAVNGKIRKASSAHAVPNNFKPRTSDDTVGNEEDVPLAFYQQQRRR